MSKLKTDYLPLDELRRWPRNPRGDHDMGAIHGSISRFGFNDPIAINKRTGYIVEGHGRLDVLQQRKAEGKSPPEHIVTDGDHWLIPVIVLDMDEAEAEAYAVAHNRTVELGGWDNEVLAQVLSDLAAGPGLEGVGFDPDDLDVMLRELMPKKDAPEAQTDRAEELQVQWQTAEGQIWQAGEHFVICGDCREPDAWARLLAAAKVEKVNGVFTSPPYAEQRKEQYGGVPVNEYVDWWEAVQANARANLAEDGSFFVNIKPHCEDGERVLYVFDLVLAMRRRWGWRFVDELCWRDTRDGVPGGWNNRFKDGFEPVYQFASRAGIRFRPDNVKHASRAVFDYSPDNARANSGLLGSEKVKGYKAGMARPSNVIEAPTESAGLGHDAPFPVALPAFFVNAYSDPGDVWADPFLGSGTTIVAAHQNDRRGIGIELLPKYVAVTLQRLSDLKLEPHLCEQG